MALSAGKLPDDAALRFFAPGEVQVTHPVRVDAAIGGPIEEIPLGSTGVFEGARPYLGADVSTEWIINTVPGMLELAMASLGAPAGLNVGLLMLMLSRARLRAQETARGVRPHWRRGHFRRIRYGEQRSESRFGWIKPVLVNAAEAFGAVRAKPYLVR